MRFGVQGLGFRVQNSGRSVWFLLFGVEKKENEIVAQSEYAELNGFYLSSAHLAFVHSNIRRFYAKQQTC